MTLPARILGWLKRARPVMVDPKPPEGPLVWCARCKAELKDAAPEVMPRSAVDPAEHEIVGALVWVRGPEGAMTACQAPEARQFRVMIGGQPHEHVDTADDGTWIYAARRY